MPQTSLFKEFSGAPKARPDRTAILDAARFTSADFMQREWDGVWTKVWLLAGFVSDLTEVGDFITFEIGRESILITRSAPGEISAVYNACQHRGNRITRLEQGSVAKIVCPYHGWTYDLDGTLADVPDSERFRQGLPCAELSLKPVRSEVWGGMVWVNMDPDAMSLADYLGDLQGQFAPYELEKMTLVGDQTVSLDANWKTCIDNFSEQYHVDFIHPQHKHYVDCYNAVNELFPYGHRRVVVHSYSLDGRYPIPEEVPPIMRGAIEPLGLNPDDFRGRVIEVRKAAQVQRRKLAEEFGFDYSRFTDDQVTDVVQFDVFPNLVMSTRPEECWIMRPRPHPTDPDKCFFDKFTLYAPAKLHPGDGQRRLVGNAAYAHQELSAERPAREVFTQDEVIAGKNSMNLTVDQDIHLLREMQAGMHSRGYRRAWLNEDESRVQHFHDWLDMWIDDAV